MPTKKPDWRKPVDVHTADKWWRFGRKPATPVKSEEDMTEAERITQWVTEAHTAAERKSPQAHASKPLFRSSSEAYSRGDKILFTSGIALSLVCAFFPWYVFLNQDQFGVRTVQLGDIPARSDTRSDVTPTTRVEAPLATDEIAGRLQLDTFTTGTLPDNNAGEEPEAEAQTAPREQPFPVNEPPFKLVHVANGRAMFEDDSGLFIAQPKSVLPDSSRVMSIEKRDGRWVVVTSNGRVIEVAQ